MRRLVLPRQARRDLNVILLYIARRSGQRRIASEFVAALVEQCRRLAALPGTLGRARPDLGPEIRSFAYRGYIILFRYGPGRIRIVNVFEGHRDIGQHVDED